MKLLLGLFLFSFCSPAQTFSWTRDFKSTYDTYGSQVLADANGNAYVVSEYHYNPNHEPPVNGCVLRKYDQAGNLQWSIDKENERYWKILFDPNGQLVLFAKELGTGTIYRAKIDMQNGNLFQKTYIFSPGTWFNSIEYDKAGNLIVTGVYRDSLVVCNNTYSGTCCDNTLFIAKFDPTYNCTWVIVSKGTPYFGWSATDASGNTFVTGSYYNKLVLGTYTLNGSSSFQGFFAKIDSNGQVLWLKRISEPISPIAETIVINQTGDVFISGGFDTPVSTGTTTLSPSGKSDAFILKMNNAGDPIWIKKLGSSQIVGRVNIFVDPNNELLISGGFKTDLTLQNNFTLSSSNTFTYNYPNPDEPFLARIDTAGNCRWAMKANCASDGTGYSTGIYLNNGYLYITGFYNGKVYFGEPTPYQGGYNMFVSRIYDPFVVGVTENELNGDHLKVLPNPANDVICLQGLQDEKSTIEIINRLGQVVKSIEGNGSSTPIQITELAPGFYFIKGNQAGRRFCAKFIKPM